MAGKIASTVLAFFRRADVFDDEALGGPHDMTISARIGASIAGDGWAASVPWPSSWKQHFANALAYYDANEKPPDDQ